MVMDPKLKKNIIVKSFLYLFIFPVQKIKPRALFHMQGLCYYVAGLASLGFLNPCKTETKMKSQKQTNPKLHELDVNWI